MSKLITILLITLYGVIHPLNAYAATYYVATNGSDTYTNLQAQNLSTPWKTIQKAADTALAGDTVYVRSGLYVGAVNFKNSGLENKPIIFKNYDSSLPEINIQSSSDWTAVYINALNWIVVDGFKINTNNNSMIGIALHNSNNITIQNSEITNSGIGIHAYAGSSTKEEYGVTSYNNKFLNNKIHNTDPTNKFDLGEGIYIKNYMPSSATTNYTLNTVISGNTIYNAREAVQNTGATWINGTVVYNENSIPPGNTTISNNIIYNNKCDQGAVSITGINHKIINNIIFNNVSDGGRKCGISLHGSNALVKNNILAGNKSTNTTVTSERAVLYLTNVRGEISNNTIYDGDYMGITVHNPKPADADLVIKNNIFSKIVNQQIYRDGDYSKVFVTNNVFSKSDTYMGTNFIVEDTIFKNYTDFLSTDFFKPVSGSKACTFSEIGSYTGAVPCVSILPSVTPQASPLPTKIINEAFDVNKDGKVDLLDVISILNYIFK